MRVLVLGAGAIGSLLGGRLADAGHDVLLVGREAHVRAVRERGLAIEGERPVLVRPRAATDAAGERPDAILVATKAHDLADAARAIAPRIPPRPTLLVQNGLDVERGVCAELSAAGWTAPERSVVRGVLSLPATWIGPGRVRAAGTGEVVLADDRSAGTGVAAVRTWTGLLESAGVNVRRTGDLPREVWRKLIVNAAINPVSALRGVVNGALADGALRREALALLEEAREVAELEGYRFDREASVTDFDLVVRATAQNRSSMLQDLERGRPTEVDAILGALLRLAREHGLGLPATAAAAGAVRARAARRPQPL